MSTWLYQLNAESWSPETFRYEIWEGERWHWGYGQKRGDAMPDVGDTVVFFYSKGGCDDPGIYGWAVLERCNPDDKLLYFIPVAPTDHLKMDPWWDEEAKRVTDGIRGNMPRATLYEVSPDWISPLRAGIRAWLGGRG